jgi:hypothetical protein
MGVGFSSDRHIIPKIIYKTNIKAGNSYEMTSSDIWHYTNILSDQPSYSVMLIGQRWRPREAQNIGLLTDAVKKSMLEEFKGLVTQ